MDAREAKLARGFDVGGDVVDVDGFGGVDLAYSQGFAIDQRIGLAGAQRAGIGTLALGEILKEIVAGFEVGSVNGIGVGQQRQPVTFREFLEHPYRMDWLWIERQIPRCGELCKVQRNAQALAEMEMPIVRGDAAFLPIAP